MQAGIEQIYKSFDQDQSENNEMKLRIHKPEKETEECRKGIAEYAILGVSLKTETIIDNQALWRDLNDFQRNASPVLLPLIR